MVVSANRWLTQAESAENARYIWEKLRAYGWSEQAIAGVLGNTQVESGHNPGIWQNLNSSNTSGGFGIVQYTPGSMVWNHAYQVGRQAGSMDFQLELLDADHFGHWIPTSSYDLSYASFKTSTKSPEWLAQAFLRNFERPANQNQPARSDHARTWYDRLRGSSSGGGGSGGSTPSPPVVEVDGSIDQMLKWMTDRQGKVTYSMTYRNGPNSYDCSSAVFYALQSAGFPIPFIGNTDTLFSMEGDLLLPISSSEKRRGDIFVSGRKGGSGGAAGHTGFCLNDTQAIHCSSRFNGIGVSSNSDATVAAYSGAPVYWYRIAGTTIAPPEPDGTQESTPGTRENRDIYITSVNNGKEYIEQPQLIELFGRIVKEEVFDEVTSPNDLLQKGRDWLNNQPLELQALSVTYAQLHEIDPKYKNMRKGDIITVKNDDLNVDARLRVENKSFTLEDDLSGLVDLGRPFDTATGWMTNPSYLVSFDDRTRR